MAQGLVAGDTRAVDSAPIKANASLESLQPKQLAQADTPLSAAVLTAPAHQLRNEAARQAKLKNVAGSLGSTHKKAKLWSNNTHYSPTDPDARVSVKPTTPCKW